MSRGSLDIVVCGGEAPGGGMSVTAELDAASENEMDLGAVASDNIRITGTASITSFGTAPAGTRRHVRMADAAEIFHDPDHILLPAGLEASESIITALNDAFIAESLGAGVWSVLVYQRASGAPVSIPATKAAVLPDPAGNAGKLLAVNSAADDFELVSLGGWQVKTTGFSMTAGGRYAADMTAGAYSAELPATPTDGDAVQVVPAKGTFATNNLTILRNGESINGSAANLVLNGAQGALLVYVAGYGWRSHVLSSFSGSTGATDNAILVADGTGGGTLKASSGVTASSGVLVATSLRLGGAAGGQTLAIIGDVLIGSTRFNYLGTTNYLRGQTIHDDAPIVMGQIASPSTVSNSALLYAMDVSGTAEMFVKDEAGNATQISAHNVTAPAWLHDGGGAKFSFNEFIGEARYQSHETGEVFIETLDAHNERTGENLEQKAWSEDQAGKVNHSIQLHTEWRARRDAFEPTEEEPAFTEPAPAIVEAKPEPEYLAALRASLPERIAAQEVALALKAKRAEMAEAFDALPLPTQAAFWGARASVESALDKGRIDVAKAMLEALTVPSELESIRQTMITHLD